MTIAPSNSLKRLNNDAGIAIGPILFIIAVLGILASAIAAGSGSFTTSTTGESNRAKSSAVIDMGMNLKIGFDRIVGNGIDFANVVIDPTSTSGVSDLFSPLGGGVSAPSVTMAMDPTTDIWQYPLIAVPNIGTASGSRVAVLRIAQGVCNEINTRANAQVTAAGADLGDFSAAPLNTVATWPAVMNGKPTGCVNNTNADTIAAGYYFYQILGIQ